MVDSESRRNIAFCMRKIRESHLYDIFFFLHVEVNILCGQINHRARNLRLLRLQSSRNKFRQAASFLQIAWLPVRQRKISVAISGPKEEGHRSVPFLFIQNKYILCSKDSGQK